MPCRFQRLAEAGDLAVDLVVRHDPVAYVGHLPAQDVDGTEDDAGRCQVHRGRR